MVGLKERKAVFPDARWQEAKRYSRTFLGCCLRSLGTVELAEVDSRCAIEKEGRKLSSRRRSSGKKGDALKDVVLFVACSSGHVSAIEAAELGAGGPDYESRSSKPEATRC